LGSLLKGSSSRRNLQAGKDDARSDKESRRGRDTDGGKSDKEKAKKEKDRSESRISVLMGRKRGQVSPTVIAAKLPSDLFPPADFVLHRVEEATASEYASHADFRVTPGNGSTRCESEGYIDLEWFRYCCSQ
jgi:dual specificity tyrosine-phosphorylation-regulated kinase 2/3/4